MRLERLEELSKDKVDRAERREGINHKIIDVLEASRDKLIEIDKGLDGVSATGDARAFIGKRLGFLAEEFGKVAPFTLELLEIVAIWSKLTEIVSHESLRDDVAFLLELSYAVQGLDDPLWKDLPKYFLETSELPANVINRASELSYVRERAGELEQKLMRGLYKYMWGSDKHIMELGFDIIRPGAGPKNVEEAKRRYEEACARAVEHKTPLLLKVIKEFCISRMVLFYDLSERALPFVVKLDNDF